MLIIMLIITYISPRDLSSYSSVSLYNTDSKKDFNNTGENYIVTIFFLKKALFEKLSGRKSTAAHSPSPFSVNRCSQAFRNL